MIGNNHRMQDHTGHRGRGRFIVMAVLAIGLLFRASGLFRGLEADYIFHPDAPKQVVALGHFLEDRYVWYVGSLFYDGYPLGLNHVDEWILRPALALQQQLREYLLPESLPPLRTARIQLYYWARILRVLYGLLCLGLTLSIVRRVTGSQGSGLAALTLAALAPLSITVTHAATGDIGADLFTLTTLACLCRYAEGSRLHWLAFAGAATGMAFASKYQGALAGLPVAFFLLLEYRQGWRHLRLLAASIIAATGFMAGAIMGTPAFLINSHRTWSDIRANFDFIRNYNVSAEFSARTPWQKLVYCLTTNSTIIVSSLGWILVLLAFSGLIVMALKLVRDFRTERNDTRERSRTTLALALCLFPFVAILASLLGKPSVQPFHFSYLLAPLVIAATLFLRSSWVSPRPGRKVIACLLYSLALAEAVSVTLKEDFFWRRGDTQYWADQMPGQLLRDPAAHSTEAEGMVKSLYLEPGGLAIFRNRAHEVLFPHAEFWNTLHIAPVPDVPFSVDNNWLFPNGPVFPRNDRMLRISRNTTTSRHVVLHTPPGPVQFGIRSGSWPVEVDLDYGGDVRTAILTPNSQQVLTSTPRSWRRSRGLPEDPEGSWIIPLEIRARYGTAVVTLMTQDNEVRHFRFFGGELTERSQLVPADLPTPEVAPEVGHLAYLGGQPHVNLAAPLEAATGYRFPDAGLLLPCGPYLVECEVRTLTPEARMTLKLDDLNRCDDLTVFEETHALRQGLTVITSRFAKVFAPYESQLELVCRSGRCRLESWSLVPDTARIRADLSVWAAGGDCPAWVGRGATTSNLPPDWSGIPLTFNESIRLNRLVFPATLRRNEPVRVACSLEFIKGGLGNFQDYVLFIHLLDKEGHTAHQFHIPLWQAMAMGSLNRPISCEAPPPTLPIGSYNLELGLYNARTEKRVSIQGAGLTPRELRKRNHVFGKTVVEL